MNTTRKTGAPPARGIGMTKCLPRGLFLTGLVVGLASTHAFAWGPRAQQIIPSTSFQLLRDASLHVFKSQNANYEEDVLLGATAGSEVLSTTLPLNSEAEAMAAVASEIQLLREVRRYGMGSYLAYRMGVLSALVADLMLPYGMTWTEADARLRLQIEADIDDALGRYQFSESRPRRVYVHDVPEYFKKMRLFFAENKRMIADDYARGQGYNGFLRRGGEAYFCRAVEAVANVWYTVLRLESELGDTVPSGPVLARYFIDEIAYLLREKGNLHQADKAYERFGAANPGRMQLYEQVGDLYYEYGTDEAKKRGVREWRIAWSQSGPHRRSVARKLSNHFFLLGDICLEAGTGPDATDRDLPLARRQFTQALEFDGSNEPAARRLNETNIQIAAREVRRQFDINIIATTEQMVQKADTYRVNQRYGSAIAEYKKAIDLFDLVSGEFPEQADTAREGVKSANLSISEVVNDVLDAASDAIATGDDAVSEHRWDEARTAYQDVEGIVSVISDDDSVHARYKRDRIEEAQSKLAKAEETEARVLQAQQQAREAAASQTP